MNGELLPREKLIKYGPNKLNDGELLSIMLGSGSKNEDVFTLSKRLINEYGFAHLFQMSYDELSNIKGIKEAKATKLLALFEIARRIAQLEYKEEPLLLPINVYKYVRADYLFLNYEKLSCIFVNSKCIPIHKKSYTDELINKAIFPIQGIVRDAIGYKAFGVFLVHNHPSGDPNPSKDDIESTKALDIVLKSLNILLLDHIILTTKKIYSICEERIFFI